MASQHDILDHLTDVIADATARPGALNEAPGISEAYPTIADLCPYFWIDPLPGTEFFPPAFALDFDHAAFLFDVMCVGQSAAQAAWLNDRIRSVLIDTANWDAPEGAKIVELVPHDGPRPIERVGEALIALPETYRIRVVAAS